MKTKFYFILSILLILPYLNNLLAGNKNFVITKKFNSSKDYYDNSSKMTFSDKDKVTEKSLKKWIVGNSNRLMVKDNLIRIEKYEDVWAYGAYRNTFIKNVYFVKSSNYEAYSNYVAKERLSEEMAGAVAVAGLLGLGKAFYDAAKEGMNDMMTHQSSSSSSSSSNYSSSSKDYEIISSENADIYAEKSEDGSISVSITEGFFWRAGLDKYNVVSFTNKNGNTKKFKEGIDHFYMSYIDTSNNFPFTISISFYNNKEKPVSATIIAYRGVTIRIKGK